MFQGLCRSFQKPLTNVTNSLRFNFTFVSKSSRNIIRSIDKDSVELKRPYVSAEEFVEMYPGAQSYKTVVINHLSFSIESPNCYLRTRGGDIMNVVNIIKTQEGEIKLICKCFEKKQSAYKIQLPNGETIKSSCAGIYLLVGYASTTVQFCSVDPPDIYQKCVVQKFDSRRMICYPLLNL